MISACRLNILPGLFTIAFCSLIATLTEARNSTNPVQEDEIPSMTVKVVDETGKPVEGVKLYASFISNDRTYQKKNPVNQLTNTNGQANIPVYPKLRLLRIWASKSGFVTLFFNWEENEVNEIPSSFKITLQKGTRLSGVVVDAKGKPVAGAKLDISLASGGIKIDQQQRVSLNPWLAEGDAKAVTDENGIWTINNAPPGDNLKLRFLIEHPGFIKDKKRKEMVSYNVSLPQLRKGTAMFELTTGTPIKGRVTDPQGKPVTSGLVIWGDRPYWETGSQEVQIDKTGGFVVPPRPPGKIRLTVVAPGWMPTDRMVEVGEPDQSRQDFSLRKGKKLRLKFVNAKKEVIPDVYVSIKNWHGHEALYNTRHPNVKPTSIPFQADDKGIYTWDWAPDDPIQLVVADRQSKALKEIEVVAKDSVQVIELKKPFALYGNVVNAETEEPVTKYAIVPITYRSASKTVRGIAQSSWRKEFNRSDFKFENALRGGVDRFVAFRFQAVGFRDYTTKRFSPDSPPMTTTIRLKPAERNFVRILEPDGKPSSTARLWVAKPDQGTMVNRFGDYFTREDESAIKVRSGIAHYGTPESRYALVAASPTGYAEKYAKANQQIDELKLQPWARLEGELIQDGQPVPAARIVVRPIRQLGGDHPHVQDIFVTQTDTNGKFVFEKLPPVPTLVRSPLSPWADFPITSSQEIPVNLKPGKTHKVSLGGEGLQIVGKVILRGDNADKIEFRYGLNNMVRLKSGIKTPLHAQSPNPFETGESKEWTDKLMEGLAPEITPESFFVKLKDDGTFQISGVRQDKYRFLLKIYEPPTGCLVEPIGYGFVEFSTKDYEAKNNQIDLGTIDVKLKPFPKTGDFLPNFRYQNMDGKPKFISEFRGKYLLVDFWASWCRPCIQAFPEIAEFHRQVEKDKDIAILSLSIDEKLSDAKTTAIRERIDWNVGYAGESARKTTSKNMLGVSSVPTYLVLDPKGKIIFRGFSHEEAIKVIKKESRKK